MAAFRWYASSVSQGCELSWNVGNARRYCDEIRLAFISDHVGLDTTYAGSIFATFSYFDAETKASKRVTPTVQVVVGDQSQPSKFVWQGVIKFEQPVQIKPGTLVTLFTAAFPTTGVGTQTVVVQFNWFNVAYFLRGNEDSARLGGT